MEPPTNISATEDIESFVTSTVESVSKAEDKEEFFDDVIHEDDLGDDDEDDLGDILGDDDVVSVCEEEAPVCWVCMKDKTHWFLECPFLECIPDPKNTKLGFGYRILCKCCHIEGGHKGYYYPWEGIAMVDPLAHMYVRPLDEPDGMITDLGKLETVKSMLAKDPEFREWFEDDDDRLVRIF